MEKPKIELNSKEERIDIDLNTVPSGVYMFTIFDGKDQIQNTKFIKIE